LATKLAEKQTLSPVRTIRKTGDRSLAVPNPSGSDFAATGKREDPIASDKILATDITVSTAGKGMLSSSGHLRDTRIVSMIADAGLTN
jgi:hypothetical protein